MIFRKYDAGATERAPIAKNRDCQVRAYATAKSISYASAWSLLYTIQGEQRACEFTLVESLDSGRLASIRKLPFPAQKGKPRMSVAAFCERHKRGRFILRCAGHVVAVKDGQFYDTGDCSHSCVYTAWEVAAESA